MDKMIACCGLICTECPAFLATQNDDDSERKKVAEMWAKEYDVELKPANINCDGCLSENKRLIGHCMVCEIRKCCKEKQLLNCALCDDFACEKLSKYFSMAPQIKSTLEEIRKET